jgi:HEAT repeat protein
VKRALASLRRPKAIVVIAGLAAFATLALAAAALWPLVVEEYWIHKLGTGRPEEREAAATALGERRTQRAVPYLIEELRADMLRSERRPGIHPAAMALARIGRPGIEGLTPFLGERGLVHYHAANALAHAGAEAVPAIVRELETGNEFGRVYATFALLNMRAQARAAVPSLVARLMDESAWVRGNAAIALGNVAEGTPEFIAALSELLQNPEEPARGGALFALEILGRESSPPAIAALEEASRSVDRTLREAASEALKTARER